MVGCAGRALRPRQTVISICNFYCRAGLALGFAVAGPAVAADSITEFDQWLARYEAAPADSKPGLVAEGVRLAKRREPAMRRLIATQPRLALQRAVSRLVRLPGQVPRHLEQHAQELQAAHLQQAKSDSFFL